MTYGGASYLPQYAGSGLLDLLGLLGNQNDRSKPPYMLSSNLFPDMDVSAAPSMTGQEFKDLVKGGGGAGQLPLARSDFTGR